MSRTVDETHDPGLRSWVESANREGGDFPVQNLPYGVFRRGSSPRIGVAIGDEILDLRGCREEGLLDGLPAVLREASSAPLLNPLMALGTGSQSLLRRRLSDIVRVGGPESAARKLLVPAREAELLLPAAVGDYTDFYASIFHATSVGRLFRPESPLLPNYKHVPIAYHGRSSSLVPSGHPVHRPCGQRKPPGEEAPSFGPSRLLDYEMEVGFLVGPGNELGRPVKLANAEEHVFGLLLVNDWSARDVQAWEYQPLGPFLSKSFLTSLSPWVVTLEALAPFRCPAFSRPEGDPSPLAHLDDPGDTERGGLDVTLEVYLLSERMRRDGREPHRLSRSSFKDMYWTVGQMLTHHTSGGCNLRPGDLVASGTVSGPGDGEQGCLLEITRRGAQPLTLPGGEERSFLADGDEVILRGHCARPGHARIGFGECRGLVLPASETS